MVISQADRRYLPFLSCSIWYVSNDWRGERERKGIRNQPFKTVYRLCALQTVDNLLSTLIRIKHCLPFFARRSSFTKRSQFAQLVTHTKHFGCRLTNRAHVQISALQQRLSMAFDGSQNKLPKVCTLLRCARATHLPCPRSAV